MGGSTSCHFSWFQTPLLSMVLWIWLGMMGCQSCQSKSLWILGTFSQMLALLWIPCGLKASCWLVSKPGFMIEVHQTHKVPWQTSAQHQAIPMYRNLASWELLLHPLSVCVISSHGIRLGFHIGRLLLSMWLMQVKKAITKAPGRLFPWHYPIYLVFAINLLAHQQAQANLRH